jgi:hypothetical protein
VRIDAAILVATAGAAAVATVSTRGGNQSVEHGAAAARAMDIQLVLYVLDPAQVTITPVGDRFAIAPGVWLRLVGSDLSAGPTGPHVLSLALELDGEAAPAGVAEALWAYLRPRRGGRGVVTARLVRRREERRDEVPGGEPAVERHELWFAIPLRSSRSARRQIDAFFAEVLQPS